MQTLTTNQAIAGGLALGSILGGVSIVILIFYIFLIIAEWKIFTKAGEKGWKSLIPIYNIYILCKIIKVNFWIFWLLLPLGLGFIGGLISAATNNQNFQNLLTSIYTIFIHTYTTIMLGRAFNKSTAFKIGMWFFPNIFQLILAFGSSKYALK